MFVAFLPSIQCSLIISETPSSSSTFSLFEAFITIVSISLDVKGSKYISAHLERRAGFISWGSLVVAPIKIKSAGAPCSNKNLTYLGTFSSSGS